jgi:cytochrome c553
MTRLMVFLGVLAGFIFALVLFSYNNLPVNNSKFDIKKVEEAHHANAELIHELTAPKEHVAVDEEAVVKEYAPVVDLNTPQLVAGHKLFNQCISCHGKGGEGKSSQKAPFIGGQFDWYIEKQLTDMKSGTRINPPMATIVKGLSPQDIKDVAAYVSHLPWKKEVPGAAPAAEAAPAAH